MRPIWRSRACSLGMQVLRIARPLPCTKFLRRNATLQTIADSSAPLEPPPLIPQSSRTAPPSPLAAAGETLPERKTKGRKRPFQKPKRPPISIENPRRWNRPLGLGVLPAYDEALKVIRADSIRLKKELGQVKVAIGEAEARPEGERDEGALEGLRKKQAVLEVQSEINLPEVRWRCANAMVDMSKPVHRHLVEQKWRSEGGLDLLMERIHQMHVVPDVLPDLHPSFDLHITTPTSKEEYFLTKSMYKDVEPGVFLLPQQTRKPPKLYANIFHTDTRLYTLLMVDPDVPDEENQSFLTYLHWMQPNIPLSAMNRNRILGLHTHTRYIPPHPQRGTPYHRYVILLLPQPSPTQPISVPVVPDSQRLGFDVRQFTAEYGLDGAKGGGAHMWREVWNEEVSDIYRDILDAEEPRYGRPQKPDRYAEVKRIKRYI